jgi:aerobic-type carbon monoxide dehydrogenase small subunit (CoxS/CutS family)
LRINGALLEVDPPVGRTLAETLRDELGLTGTKIACGEGHCGACTVQLDGVPVLSCITLVHTVGDREVTTIEGLRDHALVDTFVRADALQCGFCTPGQIVSAAALVDAEPNPTPARVRHAIPELRNRRDHFRGHVRWWAWRPSEPRAARSVPTSHRLRTTRRRTSPYPRRARTA